MKRFVLLFVLILVALIGTAQERTVDTMTFDRNPNGKNYTYYSYTGTSSDILLPTTRDTILVPFDTKKPSAYEYDFIMKYDPYTTADTTVTVKVVGRNSTNESWTVIQTDVSSAVTTDGVVQSISSGKTASIAAYTMLTDTTGLAGYPADSISVPAQTITYTDKIRYRYIGAMLILTGDDSVGTGIELKQLELKLWQ